jgi:TolA-binding protein
VVDTSDRNVAERFRRAEDLLLKDNDVDGALAQYQSIVADFPLSPYAPKAECARAWTLEYMKGDIDSARTIFKQLAEKYPDSECAALAQKKITPPPVVTPADTTTPAPADTTTPAVADTTVQATTSEELEGREEGEEGVQIEEELDRRRPGLRQ